MQTNLRAAGTVSLLVLSAAALYAERAKSEAISAWTVVTADYYSRNDHNPPALPDVAVSTPAGTVSVISLKRFDPTDPVQVYLAIDDCSNLDAGSAVAELHAFLRSQPTNMAIGSAYIRDGHIDVVQRPNGDRESLIRSLRPPAGCRPTSPFAALSELIQGWDESTVRRIVILISNGMDPEVKPGYSSDSAEAALALAQRAGVVIFAIYHPASRYEALPFGTVYSGQVLLSHVAFESGGQGYFAGAGPLDSIAPFLSDIAARLEHQYKLEFLLKPDGTTGLQPIYVRSNNRAFELVAPSRVWIALR